MVIALIAFFFVVALQISERATVDVPVVFMPTSKELQKVWLCITLKPIGNQDNSIPLSADCSRLVCVVVKFV